MQTGYPATPGSAVKRLRLWFLRLTSGGFAGRGRRLKVFESGPKDRPGAMGGGSAVALVRGGPCTGPGTPVVLSGAGGHQYLLDR